MVTDFRAERYALNSIIEHCKNHIKLVEEHFPELEK
jgi:hypothetical protein